MYLVHGAKRAISDYRAVLSSYWLWAAFYGAMSLILDGIVVGSNWEEKALLASAQRPNPAGELL
ncbi:MAG: hypothetical protein NPIRA05_01460 [Nitrospirales bacterium]|nr:MAG: hypothetical protein NPIRA05_01460 [Nitrospirales bacterium]